LVIAISLIALTERPSRTEANRFQSNSNKAQFARDISVTAASRGNPSINLNDGHALITAFSGSEDLQGAMASNQAAPLSLATADFDEDGVPDLVSGYAFRGKGIVSLWRGNVDAIYPNAPEAIQRKTAGTFSDTPFLSPARLFASPIAADFVGAGDFDADGHWDFAVASRTSKALSLFSGDGRGGFAIARAIDLSGVVTAMTTGEINRADGLADLVIAVSGESGSQLLVFEGPEGALRAHPEVFKLKAPATALALGQLDAEYPNDLAVASGNEVLLVTGRDRKLSLDETLRAQVPPAVIGRTVFETHILAITVGRFTEDGQSIAVLDDNGAIQLLNPITAAKGNSTSTWKRQSFAAGAWSGTQLVTAHSSATAHDDLLVVDPAGRQLHVLNSAADGTPQQTPATANHLTASFDLLNAPLAVLPMRLNGDGPSDLILLTAGNTSPVVVPTQVTTTFVVTNTNANGPGSLLFAMTDANENPGADLITFNIPGTGKKTINQTAALPIVTDQVTIDGTTQPGFAGTPLIFIDGSGITLSAGNNTIRGLEIDHAPNAAPVLLAQDVGANIIEGNVFDQVISILSPNNTVGGTVAAAANQLRGLHCSQNSGGNAILGNLARVRIRIQNSNGNSIGGTAAGSRNIINGAPEAGVQIMDAASFNRVQGNYIGTNAAGTVADANVFGVLVEGQGNNSNNTVGGTVVSARNVIAGNLRHGVFIAGSLGNQVQGNYVGTDVNGTADLGNGENGILISSTNSANGGGLDTTNNVIGGSVAGAANLVSGNGLSGVLIDGPKASTNIVQGNFIGTNATGTVALGNDLNGVTTSEAPNNTIGGATTASRNIISANGRHGVSIGIDTGSGATGITVQNNYIGTDVTGNNCLGNGRDGVFVNRGSVSHTIIDNLITCNQRNGVNIPNFPTNDPGIQIKIINNFIYANASLGIDLGDAGVTDNDFQDGDGGANFQQNFGLLFALITPRADEDHSREKVWSALSGAHAPLRPDTVFTVDTHLNSTPNTTFTVHWYFSAGAQCVANQLPSRPLAFGRVPGVTTDANGDASVGFAFEFPPGIMSGLINTTTTDPNGNTSEFSPCLAVSLPPSTTTMQFSATSYPVSEDAGSVTVTVTRAGNTAGASTVDFATSDGGASQSQDYVVTSGTLNFAAGETSKTFSVLIVDDGYVEAGETINLVLMNAIGGDLAVPGKATITITDNDSAAATSPVARRFAAFLDGTQETPANNSLAKGTGYVLLNPSETAAQVGMQFQSLGSTETAAHIHGPGAPGVSAPILFTLPTTNPVINFSISPTAQQVADLKAGLHYLNVHSTNFANGEIRGQLRWNPTLEGAFFVREQYLDFLSRDGDPGGFGFWVNQVESCGADAQCLHDRTITTSNAFFFEPEFQQTAGYVFRAYRAAFGNNQPFPNPDNSNATEANKLIDYDAFVADRARVVGGANLAQAQQAFANQFVLRPAFINKHVAATTAGQFVDAILATIQTADSANLTSQRQALIDQYNNAGGGNAGRAMVLYRLADDNAQSPINNQGFITAEYNRQFALTLYFGYLRRNPDIGGFLFWQSQINLAPVRDVPKQNALVCSFLTAAEYQLRFGSNAPRSNAECPQ
jgi:hypothetical protein